MVEGELVSSYFQTASWHLRYGVALGNLVDEDSPRVPHSRLRFDAVFGRKWSLWSESGSGTLTGSFCIEDSSADRLTTTHYRWCSLGSECFIMSLWASLHCLLLPALRWPWITRVGREASMLVASDFRRIVECGHLKLPLDSKSKISFRISNPFH